MIFFQIKVLFQYFSHFPTNQQNFPFSVMFLGKTFADEKFPWSGAGEVIPGAPAKVGEEEDSKLPLIRGACPG